MLAERIRSPALFRRPEWAKVLDLRTRNQHAKTLWQLLGWQISPQRDPAMLDARPPSPHHLPAKNGKPTTSCGLLYCAVSIYDAGANPNPILSWPGNASAPPIGLQLPL